MKTQIYDAKTSRANEEMHISKFSVHRGGRPREPAVYSCDGRPRSVEAIIPIDSLSMLPGSSFSGRCLQLTGLPSAAQWHSLR